MVLQILNVIPQLEKLGIEQGQIDVAEKKGDRLYHQAPGAGVAPLPVTGHAAPLPHAPAAWGY